MVLVLMLQWSDVLPKHHRLIAPARFCCYSGSTSWIDMSPRFMPCTTRASSRWALQTRVLGAPVQYHAHMVWGGGSRADRCSLPPSQQRMGASGTYQLVTATIHAKETAFGGGGSV
jgi:hypothetical protein